MKHKRLTPLGLEVIFTLSVWLSLDLNIHGSYQNCYFLHDSSPESPTKLQTNLQQLSMRYDHGVHWNKSNISLYKKKVLSWWHSIRHTKACWAVLANWDTNRGTIWLLELQQLQQPFSSLHDCSTPLKWLCQLCAPNLAKMLVSNCKRCDNSECLYTKKTGFSRLAPIWTEIGWVW